MNMRFALSLIAVCALAIVSTGCASAEKKLGRGLRNATEFARMGEMGHSIEQSYMFEDSYAVGAVRGFNRSIARTAVGVFEVITFPIPTKTIGGFDKATYPDTYQPNKITTTTFETDSSIGFSGSDVAPMLPGSRFRVFED